VSRGRLVIISAPSGAGKTSLAKALVNSVPNTVLSVSHTTRSRRAEELDGVDYHFVNKEQFQTMVREGKFLEYARVFNNYYGTSHAVVEQQLSRGNNVLLDIDWQGAREVKQKVPDVCSIFVLPPSREELERRLRDRGQDSEMVIADRMREASKEMRHHDEYAYLVVNDDFDRALADLSAIITGNEEQRRPVSADVSNLLRENARSCIGELE
jgi:guanylate kinase